MIFFRWFHLAQLAGRLSFYIFTLASPGRSLSTHLRLHTSWIALQEEQIQKATAERATSENFWGELQKGNFWKRTSERLRNAPEDLPEVFWRRWIRRVISSCRFGKWRLVFNSPADMLPTLLLVIDALRLLFFRYSFALRFRTLERRSSTRPPGSTWLGLNDGDKKKRIILSFALLLTGFP